MKDQRNVERGRLAKEVGGRFESWVEGQHEAAKYLGILAHVHHNEPRVKFVDGRLIYEKASVADYTGALEGGARTLAVEAKSTATARFPLSDVTPLQQVHLGAVARAGGLALLLVEFRVAAVPGAAPVKYRFAIPWLDVPWSVKRTSSAVYLDDLIISDWNVRLGCYLSRWHAGGPRSTPGKMPYPAE